MLLENTTVDLRKHLSILASGLAAVRVKQEKQLTLKPTPGFPSATRITFPSLYHTSPGLKLSPAGLARWPLDGPGTLAVSSSTRRFLGTCWSSNIAAGTRYRAIARKSRENLEGSGLRRRGTEQRSRRSLCAYRRASPSITADPKGSYDNNYTLQY